MERSPKILNLGDENILKLLFKFSVPCVMGLLITALYNIVDQIFIGNSELGYLGNAATGVSFPIICIANAFAWCIGDGAAAFLSICAGRGDEESAHKCVGTCITLTTIVSIVLSAICLIWARPFMAMFGASAQTLDMAVEYFRIVAAFFPFYLLLNVTNSMIRADGSPAFAMIAMLTGAIVNIALDPLFIFVFKWGIAGAAWATVIGQVLSFVVCIVYFARPKTFRLTKRSFVPDKAITRVTLTIGGSTFITQISIVILSLVSNMVLAKYGELSIYGPDIPISVFSIQTKVYTVICNIVVGIVLGGQPIFGYNYGAGNLDRVRQAYKLVLKATLVIGFVAVLIFELRPQIIINIFGSGNELYQEFAIRTFRIYLSLTMITGMVKTTSIFFQAIGKPKQAMLTSIVRDVLVFTPLAIILPAVFESFEAGSGVNGILFAAPIADLAALAVILGVTVPFFKKMKRQESEIKK